MINPAAWLLSSLSVSGVLGAFLLDKQIHGLTFSLRWSWTGCSIPKLSVRFTRLSASVSEENQPAHRYLGLV